MEGEQSIRFVCALPEFYPSKEPPLFELKADWLEPLQVNLLIEELEKLARESVGEVRGGGRGRGLTRGRS